MCVIKWQALACFTTVALSMQTHSLCLKPYTQRVAFNGLQQKQSKCVWMVMWSELILLSQAIIALLHNGGGNCDKNLLSQKTVIQQIAHFFK